MTREDLTCRIRDVFPDPKWPKNKSLVREDPRTIEARYAIKHFQGKRWTDLTSKQLSYLSQDAWVFTTEALAFFFPAWLTEDLNRPSEHILSMYGLLVLGFGYRFTSEQKSVIRDSLQFLYSDYFGTYELLPRLIEETNSSVRLIESPRGPVIMGPIEIVEAFTEADYEAMGIGQTPFRVHDSQTD